MKYSGLLKLRRLFMLTTLATATSVIGFNCGRTGFQTSISEGGLQGFGIKPELPWGVLTYEQILKAFGEVSGVDVGTLGSTNPIDAEILSVYESRTGSFTAQRDIDTITGPMMVSVTNLALAVCNKVYEVESTTDASQRRFFGAIDFRQPASVISVAALSDSSRRVARAFWRRELTEEELSLLAQEMLGPMVSDYVRSEVFTQGAAPSTSFTEAQAQTKIWVVGLCTAMMSSFDTLTY